MQVRVSRWGNSLAVRLPKAIAEDLQLAEGQAVNVEVEDGSLRLRPLGSHRFPTLGEMIAEMDRLGPENEPPTVDWGPDVGSKIINDEYSR
jgi:antitoxin MazE